MDSSESRTFAQFGGVLLLVSLLLPYFAISFADLGSYGFRLWRLDRGACVLVAAYALLAIAQLKMSSRETMALIYLICGGLFTAALIYKFWVSPPGSAPLGEVANRIGGGSAGGGDVTTSLTINGKPASSISANDFLESFGLELKPSYGAFLATLGSVFVTLGAFLEFRKGGAPDFAPSQPLPQAAPVPAGQRYQAPTPQAFAPDPFAPPVMNTPAAPVTPATAVPPDPFAPPAQQPAPPAGPQPPYSPPGPPAA